MKRTAIALALFALTGSAALAQSAVDAAAQALANQGFTKIEISRGVTTSKIEATNGTQKVEVTIDNATGRQVKSETSGLDDSPDVGDDNGNDGSEPGDDNGGDRSGSDDGGGDDHGGSSGHDGSGGGGNSGHGGHGGGNSG